MLHRNSTNLDHWGQLSLQTTEQNEISTFFYQLAEMFEGAARNEWVLRTASKSDGETAAAKAQQQQQRRRNAEQRKCTKVTSEEAENTHNDINQWWAAWDLGFKAPPDYKVLW